MKVSACIITYNHENYIAKCLEGALMQIVDFDYEIIIGEDRSNDKTLEICTEYALKYPEKIKLIKREQNLGMVGNWMDTIFSCTGEYIALCEGDDFWTDPYKLVKQIKYLDENPNFSFSFHPVQVIGYPLNYSYHFKTPKRTILSASDIIFNHYIPTCSILLRSEFIPRVLPKWFLNNIVVDIPIELILADKGPVYFLNDSMATYRKHDLGITSNANHQKRTRNGFISLYKNLNSFFNKKYDIQFNIIIFKNVIAIMLSNIKSLFR